MGCNCGGGKRSARHHRRKSLKPSVGPVSIQGGTAAGPNPAQLRALGLQKSISVTDVRRLDENRLILEKKRRDAIRRRLNK